MLSFPNSPRSGQSYAAPSGQIYVWDGVKWIGTSISGGGGSTSWADITDKPSFFSGNYSDLTDKPDLAGTYQFYVAADDSTQRLVSTDELIKISGSGTVTTSSDGEGNITITGSGITASSSDTFTNKTINIAFGQGNTFQIQGNSISSYSGSGPILALTAMPTFTGLNIGNGANLTIDGGTGSYYWGGQTGVAVAGIEKAGVYRSTLASNNSLFTFGANGTGTMSAAIEGSLFLGTVMPSNNGGLNTNYAGWLVAQAGGKFGGDINTTGNFILDTSGRYVQFSDGSMQYSAYTGTADLAKNIANEGDVSIKVNLSDSTQRIWQFGEDGNAIFPGDLTVHNLTVNGTSTTINTESYTVSDNIMQIADGNVANTIDIGFVAHRTVGATLEHTGLVRDASDDKWVLFKGLTTQPGNTIDFTGVTLDTLQLGTLEAGSIVSGGATWTFGTDSKLTLPIVGPGAQASAYLESPLSIKLTANDSTWAFKYDGSLILPSLTGTYDSIGKFYDNLAISSGDNVVIMSNNTGIHSGDSKAWSFGYDGTLIFPDNTVQTTAYTGYHDGDMTGSVFADDSTLLVDGVGAKIVGEVNSPKIRTNEISLALGNLAGNTNQSPFSVALGWYAGYLNQGSNSVAVGSGAGQNTQDQQSVAIGFNAGYSNQSSYSVAVGTGAGTSAQGNNSVAVGNYAGAISQGYFSIAVGSSAGRESQSNVAIAIGTNAGYENQSSYSIGIGIDAGRIDQGLYAIGIGSESGKDTQGSETVAIGQAAGRTRQGSKSVAIGYLAGVTDQGNHSVAIGPYAGAGSAQAADSIAINASSLGGFSPTTSGFFVNPVRNVSGGKFLTYNTSTYEIGYSSDLQSDSDINIDINLADSTLRRWTFGEDGDLNVASSVVFPNGNEVRPGNPSYEEAIAGWEFTRSGELQNYIDLLGFTLEQFPLAGWYPTGKTVQGYIDFLDAAWAIQNSIGGEPLLITPPISAALKNQLRLLLTNIRDTYSDTTAGVSVSVGYNKTWNFADDGRLLLGGSAGAIYADQTTGVVTIADSLGPNGISPAPSTSFKIGGTAYVAQLTGYAMGTWTFGADGSTTIPGDIKSNSNINIDINLADSTLRRWQFGEDGKLTLPGGTAAVTGRTNYMLLETSDSQSTGVEITTADVDPTQNGINLYTREAGGGRVTVTTNGGEWKFGNDGKLTTPGGIELTGTTLSTNNSSGLTVDVQTTFNTDIVAENDITVTQRLNVNGDVKFSDNTTQTTAFTTSPTLNLLSINAGVLEKFQTKSSATGVVTHDCSTGYIFYHTSPSANFTVNLTNLNLSAGYATSVSLVIVQGGTGYYPNAIQINGTGQTLNWQGNTTPTPSTSRTDVVTFSIINNSGTYTVLGQLSGF